MITRVKVTQRCRRSDDTTHRFVKQQNTYRITPLYSLTGLFPGKFDTLVIFENWAVNIPIHAISFNEVTVCN